MLIKRVRLGRECVATVVTVGWRGLSPRIKSRASLLVSSLLKIKSGRYPRLQRGRFEARTLLSVVYVKHSEPEFLQGLRVYLLPNDQQGCGHDLVAGHIHLAR